MYRNDIQNLLKKRKKDQRYTFKQSPLQRFLYHMLTGASLQQPLALILIPVFFHQLLPTNTRR